MNLELFELQLNEGIMGDIHTRVKELKALNNSGKEIVIKVAKEFKKDVKSIEKLLLPHKLKNIDSMGIRELQKLRKEYKQYFTKAELSRLSDKTFIDRLKDRIIAK